MQQEFVTEWFTNGGECGARVFLPGAMFDVPPLAQVTYMVAFGQEWRVEYIGGHIEVFRYDGHSSMSGPRVVRVR